MNEKEKLPITDLVVDADQTLWDWVGMHAPGMEAMAKLLSRVLKVPLNEIRASMTEVYKMAGQLDFDRLIQHMDKVIEKVVLDTMNSYSDPNAAGLHIFREGMVLMKAVEEEYKAVQKDSFQLFPHVREVLEELHKNRVRIHVLTDAPMTKTLSRLKRHGLENVVTTLFGQPASKIRPAKTPVSQPNGGVGEYIRSLEDQIHEFVPEHDESERVRRGYYQVPFKVVPLRTVKKPNIELFRLLGLTREKVRETVAVWGDSPRSDLRLALNNGCRAFFATYGQTSPENETILEAYQNPGGVNRNIDSNEPKMVELREGLGDNLIRIKDPIEILDHLNIPRPEK